MKLARAIVLFGVVLLRSGACVAIQPVGSPVPGSEPPPGGPPVALPPGGETVVATATLAAQPSLTVTAVITGSLTPTATAPTDTPPPPAVTDTPAPTDTPLPEPTSTPTDTPPPTSTPTPTPTEGPPPTPTPLPNAVFVRDHRSIVQGSDLLVVGEVTNGSAYPVFNVTVSAAFYDASGGLIGAAEAPALLPQTSPTQNNPFKVRLSNAPASVSTYELALRWDELTAMGYDRVTVVSQEVDASNGIAVRGELRNDGSAPVSDIVVAASFYDAAGNIVDTYQGAAEVTNLGPGATDCVCHPDRPNRPGIR